MTISQSTEVSAQVLSSGEVRVRRVLATRDGSSVIGQSEPHRVSYSPGDDLSSEPEWVRAMAQAAWANLPHSSVAAE